MDFARCWAVLEGVATSFPQTEEIIENGIVNGVSAADVQKILNLKHAWEFILDQDVLQSETNYYMLCHIARIVNAGFFYDGEESEEYRLPSAVLKYIPPLPVEAIFKE